MNLKEKQDLIRFEKTKNLCKGKVIHLGSSEEQVKDYNTLQLYLKDNGIESYSVGLSGANINQDLNDKDWDNVKEKYNTALAGEVIEHVYNPTEFIRNCKNILSKGGRLIISTPNSTSLIYLKNPSWCVETNEQGYGNSHRHSFTPPMLRLMMEEHNFKNIESEYLNGYMFNPLGYLTGKIIPRLRGDIMIWGDLE